MVSTSGSSWGWGSSQYLPCPWSYRFCLPAGPSRTRSYSGLFTALAAFMILAGPWYWGHTQRCWPTWLTPRCRSDPLGLAGEQLGLPAQCGESVVLPDSAPRCPRMARPLGCRPGLHLGWSSPSGRWAPGACSGAVHPHLRGRKPTATSCLRCRFWRRLSTSVCSGLGQSLSRFGLVAGLCAASQPGAAGWRTVAVSARRPLSIKSCGRVTDELG